MFRAQIHGLCGGIIKYNRINTQLFNSIIDLEPPIIPHCVAGVLELGKIQSKFFIARNLFQS